MRLIVCLLLGIFFSGSCALAAPATGDRWHANVFLYNPEVRYERDSAQQIVNRSPLNFALGARKNATTFLLEYSSFSYKSGNNTLSVERQHREYVLWWKENLMNLELVDFFAALGVGGYEEKTITRLSSSNATDTTGAQAMGGLSAGVQSLFLKYILVSAEARILAGHNFDPNPQAGFVLRFGVEF